MLQYDCVYGRTCCWNRWETGFFFLFPCAAAYVLVGRTRGEKGNVFLPGTGSYLFVEQEVNDHSRVHRSAM